MTMFTPKEKRKRFFWAHARWRKYNVRTWTVGQLTKRREPERNANWIWRPKCTVSCREQKDFRFNLRVTKISICIQSIVCSKAWRPHGSGATFGVASRADCSDRVHILIARCACEHHISYTQSKLRVDEPDDSEHLWAQFVCAARLSVGNRMGEGEGTEWRARNHSRFHIKSIYARDGRAAHTNNDRVFLILNMEFRFDCVTSSQRNRRTSGSGRKSHTQKLFLKWNRTDFKGTRISNGSDATVSVNFMYNFMRRPFTRYAFHKIHQVQSCSHLHCSGCSGIRLGL